MKNWLLILGFFVGLNGFSQNSIDSLKEVVDEHKMKISAFDERFATIESDLQKLAKIKLSGYIQAQYDYYDFSPEPSTNNTFYLRRARLKATYEAIDGVKFVLQPDFSTNSLSLKDAYVVINDRWTRTFSIWAGQFNRLNYEVEYTSTQREVLERSRVIRAIYPGEREIGVKLEANPLNFPFKFQFASFNGNFNGKDGKDAKDNDSAKDLMARAIYSLKFQKQGIGIDLGANGYYGSVKTKESKYVLNSENKLDSITIGDLLPRKWVGAEMQIYWDFLGGMSLKAEYLIGQNASLAASTTTVSQKGGTPTSTNSGGTTTTTTSGQSSTTKTVVSPNKTRDFSGYYIYLIKNIGRKNQFVAKYDSYDPNTKLSGDDAKTELYYNTLTFAWQHYFDDNIRISLSYEMPTNELNTTINKDIKDNTLSLRIQAKF
ncbi:MAG: hypothetical protein A2046_01540 [Bacteroidetes bacterium GWA2_30_7]|nr:MAG: hypothetical protein A2046_01540 [Bacteroidetes bacterium GWA2_30_7]